MRKSIILTAALLLLAWTSVSYANCWCGNGYDDPSTNFVEAQVWPGDNNASTSMDFIYTTDGSDPFTSGTAVTEPGTFYQFAGNNDWFQAWLTANNGDVVKWFARGTSADGDVCDSEMYEFTSGVTPPPPPPNMVGDCESELGVGADWQNNDDVSKMYDPDMDGIFEVTLTATADFAYGGGAGYQVVGVSGSWSPQYPGDSNIQIGFTTGEEITFYLDTNEAPGWAPFANAVYDSKLIGTTHSWAAVGDWQGWDPSNPATMMVDGGGGIYVYNHYFGAGEGGTYQFKCAADGGWDLQCGVNGYGSNSATWEFTVADGECVAFYLDTNSGRIKAEITGPSATEGSTWGNIKAQYK
jgi:hypothetical protein